MKKNLEKRVNYLKENGFVATDDELEKYARYLWGKFATKEEMCDFYENVLIKQAKGVKNLLFEKNVNPLITVRLCAYSLLLGTVFFAVGLNIPLVISIFSAVVFFMDAINPNTSLTTMIKYYLGLRKYEKILGIKRENALSKVITKFKSKIDNRNNKFEQQEEISEHQEISGLDPFIQKVAEAFQIINKGDYPGKLEDLKELKQLAGDYILANKPTTNTSSSGLDLVIEERNFYAELVAWETKVYEKIKQQNYVEKNMGYINGLGIEEPVSLTLDVKSPTLDVSLFEEEGPKLTLGKKGQ